MPTITGTTGVNDVITVTGPGVWTVDGDNSINADPGLPDDLLIVNLQNDTDGIVDRNPIFSTRSWGSRTLAQNDPNYVFIRHDRFERFELNLGSGADAVFTGDGDDIVRSGAGNDDINTGQGRAVVDLGSGVDRWQADLSALAGDGVLDLTKAAAQAFMGGSVAGVEVLNLTLGAGAHTVVTLSGAAGVGLNDTINAGGGNDVVKIGGGSDRVSGGAGDDLLIVDLSNDTNGIVNRNPISDSRSWGSSTLGSGDAGYVFIRHDGFERFDLTLGSGNDEVFTGDGDDVVRSGAGNDVVDTGAGRATVDLGAGVDFWTANLSALSGDGVLDLASGATQAFMGGSVTGVERVNLTFGAGAQTVLTLTGAAGAGLNDTLAMGEGNDVVRVGGGSDRVSGGAGFDVLILDFATDTDGIVNSNPIGSTIALESRSLASGQAGYSFVRYDGFERVEAQFGSGADTVTFYDGDDVIRAGGGADTVAGGGGSDLLMGEAGDDVLRGGDGDDTLIGGAGADRMEGGAGDDVVILTDWSEADVITLGAGRDVVRFAATAGASTTAGPVVVTDFQAGPNGDRLDLRAYLDGLANAAPGGDAFISGHLRLVQSGADTLVQIDRDGFGGPAGAVTSITLRGVTATNLTADDLGGFAPPPSIAGTANNDTLVGTDGREVIDGGAGNDRLEGRGGADGLIGGAGDDFLIGGAGNDALFGGEGRDTAAYSGLFRGYALNGAADRSATVSGGAEGGTDTLNGVELLSFADGVMSFDVNGAGATVYRMYDAALGRGPDPLGLKTWTGHVNAGLTALDLANAFLSSAEYQGRFGGLDDRGFVQQLYRLTLRREADPAGEQNWVNHLQNGTSRAQMLVAFSESQEHRDFTRPALDQGFWTANEAAAAVARLYDSVLDRRPDAGGLLAWKGQVEATSLLKVAEAFLNSAEFQTKVGHLSDQAFVARLYEVVLDRPADAGGLAAWTGQLQAGLSRAQLLLAFSESAEHQASTFSWIDRGIQYQSAPTGAADAPLVLPGAGSVSGLAYGDGFDGPLTPPILGGEDAWTGGHGGAGAEPQSIAWTVEVMDHGRMPWDLPFAVAELSADPIRDWAL